MNAMLLVFPLLIAQATITQFGTPAPNFTCPVGYSLSLPIVITDANGAAFTEATFKIVLPEQITAPTFTDAKLSAGTATMQVVNDASNRTTICTVKYVLTTPSTVVGTVGNIVATAKARTPAGTNVKLTGALSVVTAEKESIAGTLSFPTAITIVPRGPSATVNVQ